MTIPAGFLSAICADPADDTPRLVLADWLDDNGEAERAEFIRLQCELAKLPAFDGVSIIGEAHREVRQEPGPQASWTTSIGDAVSVGGLIRTQDLPRLKQRTELEQLASDLAVVLRFQGQEAPLAVYDRVNFNPKAVRGMIEARFRLFPVLDGERVVWYRPYEDPHEKRRLELQGREREILDTPGSWWTPPDLSIVGKWHRGFIHAITCTAAEWRKHGRAIVREQPIETVRLSDVEVRSLEGPDGRFSLTYPPDAYPLFRSLRHPAEPWDTAEIVLAAVSDCCIRWAEFNPAEVGVTFPANPAIGQQYRVRNVSSQPFLVEGVEVVPDDAAQFEYTSEGWRALTTV